MTYRLLGRGVSIALTLVLAWVGMGLASGGEPLVLDLWPDRPPGETQTFPPEADTTKPGDREIAGRPVIRLGHVSTPQIAVYRPDPAQASGAAVIVCPGGGHSILAYDLEGTEVAEWLNTLGITAVVLKYRVPARAGGPRWQAAVQDLQRAVRLVRSHAEAWSIDPERVGVLGFSAGGETAGRAAILLDQATYDPVDSADQQSCRPNLALLIYCGGLVPRGEAVLDAELNVTEQTPPMFFVHAFDDNVTVLTPLMMGAALKQVGVEAELHLYATGGHGYGLRRTEEPVTHWPDHAATWLRRHGFVTPSAPIATSELPTSDERP